MITTQRSCAPAPGQRSDTALIPIVSGLPQVPNRIDPRATDVLAAAGRALVAFAVVAVAALVLGAVIVAGALAVPAPLLLAGACALALSCPLLTSRRGR